MQRQVDIFLNDKKIGFIQTDDSDNNMGVYLIDETDFESNKKIKDYMNSKYNKVTENSLTIQQEEIRDSDFI